MVVIPKRIPKNTPGVPSDALAVWHVSWKEYKTILDTTDRFTGECRKACKVKDGTKQQECTNFRIPFATAILHYFKPKQWLDPCAGWGDRLIAACWSKIPYLGIDPNPCLIPGHARIIEKYGGGQQRVVVGKAERVLPKLPDSSYDLIFTSPPFFDKEIYTDAKGQSILGKTSEKEWWESFMRPVLKESIRILQTGGHLVLYIGGGDWTDWVVRYLSTRLQPIGSFYYTEHDPQRHLKDARVWKKNGTKA
jgi:tRNA G10  N-methylase Trm11